MSKEKILKDIFGHSGFRNFQEDIIDSILAKQDLLAILPTGGGKSLCYQLPALLKDGVVVVISPLIALMQDQVKALNELGIKAGMINSVQSSEENAEVFSSVRNKELKFLYLAPERLVLGDFVEFLRGVDVQYFVIDEAHCVSNWGHEFRADYRNLGQLKQNFPLTPIVAFTATATAKVRDDIILSLNLKNPKLFRAPANRDNLFISVQKRILNGSQQILQILKNHKNQCGIIYAFTRKETEKLADFLNENGIKSLAYHAGLSSEKRKAVYEEFAFENVDVVVATVAFGMGIDKSNIRFIIHTSLPKTLENYYQEIGRAGRDGESSSVYLLYSKSDEIKRLMQIEESMDDTYKELSKDKLRQTYRFCISSKCRHKLIAKYFEDEIEPCESLCDNCIKKDVKTLSVKTQVQKFLSAVYRTGQNFGANHIIDILRASKNKKVLELGHEKLSVYGVGAEFSKTQWHILVDVMLDEEILALNEFKGLKITSYGFEVLKGLHEVEIAKDLLEISQKNESKQEILGVYDEVFEKFRALRHSIANEQKVPAYIVFDDKALREISATLPQNEEEFLRVNGVGVKKLQKYGKEFLALCDEIRKTHKIPKTKLSKTHLQTLELLKEDKNIEQIATQREVSENTIMHHVNILYEHNQISLEQREELFKPMQIPPKIQSWIENGLRVDGLKKLREYLYRYELFSVPEP